MKTHKATGLPEVCRAVGELVMQPPQEAQLDPGTVVALATIHVLAEELAAALNRIKRLENEVEI